VLHGAGGNSCLVCFETVLQDGHTSESQGRGGASSSSVLFMEADCFLLKVKTMPWAPTHLHNRHGQVEHRPCSDGAEIIAPQLLQSQPIALPARKEGSCIALLSRNACVA
jgi:hypothetical protein